MAVALLLQILLGYISYLCICKVRGEGPGHDILMLKWAAWLSPQQFARATYEMFFRPK